MLHKPRRWRWKLFTVWAILFTGLVFYSIHQNRILARKGDEAHSALCTLQDDLQRRVEQSRNFLKSHPHGIPGISAKVLKDSIRNQESTLKTLLSLKCGSA